ncbi:hypothetical protein [Pedobacter gandavensis]|uniref:Nucleotide-diphospho-sugar transferase domain-containing protein n=1 Tax=Pedobacter gandavensis TaxID=2679963 RepID=A0ABR6ET21_9SPHI|nr:hypothetical protein [Pedobacter gandavensis]MBB2148412.1 hypothetical protein [Pedobacter gandavensis]
MLNKNLVLLSYGRETEYRRAIFSILSFYSWSTSDLKGLRILIYTDHPQFFEPYLGHIPIEYVLLTEALRKEMLGALDFIHRIKVGVIDLTFKQYPNDHLLFIDSDTFFTEDPKMLWNGFKAGQSFMHTKEHTLEQGFQFFNAINMGKHPKDFLDYISNRDFTVKDKTLRFDKNDYSWNSGVLGLHTSFSTVMPDVIKLSDEFYANSKWFVSEQLAFALILQKTTDIVPTEDFVAHYWGKRQKVMLDKFIAQLFSDSKNRLTEKEFIINLTLKMKRLLKDDLILEQAVLALAQRHWKYGLRKSLQVILRNPVKVRAYKELLLAVK